MHESVLLILIVKNQPPEAEQMKFEHILDLPPPLYLGTITLNYKTKAILQNISKSKNIMGRR